MKQFEKVLESYMERYTHGGFVTGDWVKFKNDVLSHPMLKDKSEAFKNRIKDFMKNDLHLKVACVKTTQDPFTVKPATEIDIVREYAPGLWADPMTVPVDVLELVDTGNNAFQHPVPDSLKRPNRTHGPEEVDAEQTEGAKKAKTTLNLPVADTKIPSKSKRWKDNKPGAGNVPNSVYSTGKK